MPPTGRPPDSPPALGLLTAPAPLPRVAFQTSARAPLLPVVVVSDESIDEVQVIDGTGKGTDGRQEEGGAGKKAKRVFCFTGGKRSTSATPHTIVTRIPLSASSSSTSSWSTLHTPPSSLPPRSPSTHSAFSSPGQSYSRLFPPMPTVTALGSGLDLKVALEKDLFLALESQIAREGEMFDPLEHTDTRETSVRIDFSEESGDAEGRRCCGRDWGLSEDVKAVLREAASLTRRRILVLLSSSSRSLLPPHLRSQPPPLSRASSSLPQDFDADARISFHALERLLRQVYGTIEDVKRERGRRGVIVDVGIEGWSRGADGQVASASTGRNMFFGGGGWSRTFGPVTNNPTPPTRSSSTTRSTAPPGSVEVGTMAVGGTFDHLGANGKVRLTMSAWSARERLVVGICTDPPLDDHPSPTPTSTSNSVPPLSLETRTALVHRFLSFLSPDLRLSLPSIDRTNERTWAVVTDSEVQGVVVHPNSDEAKAMDRVDDRRRRKGYPPLTRFVLRGDGEEQGHGRLPRSEAVRRWVGEKERESRGRRRESVGRG